MANRQSERAQERTKQAETMTAERQKQQDANQRLWAAYAVSRSPDLREQLILQYAQLVKYVLKRLSIHLPTGVDYEDMLSVGTIGLIGAVERFDHTQNVKFETYAIARIRGSIYDALRSLDRLPRSVREKAKNARKVTVDLALKLERVPTEAEIAAAMGLTVEAYRKHLVDAAWTTTSLDTLGFGAEGEDGSGGPLGIADPDAVDADRELEGWELMQGLADAIGALSEREQLLLTLYYKEELTMREVSKVLGISESRVCQLHARALVRLNERMTEAGEDRAA